jgi:integrase
MKRRADGRFQKRVTLPDGSLKYLYSSAANERLAIKDFNEQLMNLELETQKKGLFTVIANAWYTEYRERISDINYRKNTSAAYDRIIEYFQEYYIEEMTAPILNKFIRHLALLKFGKKTVANHHSIINMIFKFAILNGQIDYNPMQDVPIPTNLSQKKRSLPSDKELETVNANYEGFAFLPYFLLNTGLRMSEALALTYDDIDFEEKLITVNKHLLHDNNKPVIEAQTKTESSKRTVILLDRVADKLSRTKKGLIFCNEDGSPLTKCQLKRRWEKYQKTYNVTLTAHQLRHGFATMLFEADVDVKDAQELMGHSDINTTRSIYTHIRNKRKSETAKKLNEYTF